MCEEHDEALVERVALALYTDRGFISTSFDALPNKGHWLDRAREVIYPPAPPKTRLEVARELVSEQFRGNPESVKNILSGSWDTDRYMKAVLAALALDKMEEYNP